MVKMFAYLQYSNKLIEPTLDRFLTVTDRNLYVTVRNTGNWSAYEIALTDRVQDFQRESTKMSTLIYLLLLP